MLKFIKDLMEKCYSPVTVDIAFLEARLENLYDDLDALLEDQIELDEDIRSLRRDIMQCNTDLSRLKEKL